MGIRYAKPPVLMHDVIGDLDAVTRLLESQAPYTPLGGWYSPGADPNARTRPMWFQNDWVHDTFAAEGSNLFLRHQGYIDAAKQFYGAEVVEPKSVYVNLMTAIADGGPAHTDNPRFRGRDRTYVGRRNRPHARSWSARLGPIPLFCYRASSGSSADRPDGEGDRCRVGTRGTVVDGADRLDQFR